MRTRLSAVLLAATLAVTGTTLGGCTASTATHGSQTGSARVGGDTVGSGLAVGSRDEAGLEVVSLASLPSQAATTVRLVQQGGPFPYRQDGVVYHNNNRVLPRQRDGYYHEYTVKTPGVGSRGARRIIHGKGTQYWYTADHYDSFQRIA